MIDLVLIAAGLVCLVWSSDRFIDGAAAIAHHGGLSPLLIGMTIVSLGTSAPEIVVSIIASLSEAGSLAVGNALGSNITNIGLVLGVTLCITSIVIDRQTVNRELLQVVCITLLVGVLMADNILGKLDGLLLLIGLAAFLVFLANSASEVTATADTSTSDLPLGRAWWSFSIGLAVLIASSRMLVVGAVNIATSLGVSELIIGLTIVAIGTSLPELAASVVSALRGQSDIAIGAIIGSNIFNFLVVLAVPGVLGPLSLEPSVMVRDWPVTLLLTLVIAGLSWWALRATRPGTSTGELGRASGVLLVAIYASYVTWLIVNPDTLS